MDVWWTFSFHERRVLDSPPQARLLQTFVFIAPMKELGKVGKIDGRVSISSHLISLVRFIMERVVSGLMWVALDELDWNLPHHGFTAPQEITTLSRGYAPGTAEVPLGKVFSGQTPLAH